VTDSEPRSRNGAIRRGATTGSINGRYVASYGSGSACFIAAGS